jgi:hypothetical protein
MDLDNFTEENDLPPVRRRIKAQLEIKKKRKEKI